MYCETGAHFDGAGNLKNLWSDVAKERFDNRSQCFIKQYSSHFVEEAKLHVSLN